MMPHLIRAGLGMAGLLAVSGCASSSLSQFVAESHANYEAAYLSGAVSRQPAATAPRSSRHMVTSRPAARATAVAAPVARAPAQSPAVADTGNTGSVGPPRSGSTGRLLEPKIGSPRMGAGGGPAQEAGQRSGTLYAQHLLALLNDNQRF